VIVRLFDVHRGDLFSVDVGQTINLGVNSIEESLQGGLACLTPGVLSLSDISSDLLLETSGFSSLDSEDLAVWVEFFHSGLVSQGISLGASGSSWLFLGLLQNGLDGITVDKSVEVSSADNILLESVATLDVGSGLSVTEDLFEGIEGGLGPDAESSQMTTWGELSDVKSVDVADIDSGDVSNSSSQRLATLVDDEERSSSHLVSPVSHFSLSSSELLVGHNSSDVVPTSEGLEHGDGVSGLGDLSNGVVQNQRQLGSAHDSVTSGQNQGSTGGGGNSRGKGVSSLVEVDLSVPPSPGLQRMGHSSLSAHVTESGLSRSVGT